MDLRHLNVLCCPECTQDLEVGELTKGHERCVETGTLHCVGCSAIYPIIGGIPRFVPVENYASSFGLEWTQHSRTQYDSYSGVPLSERRFFEETRWPRDAEGEWILEVGSGSGRFTEHAASTGGMVVSMDYSYAVEANYASNGQRPNVLVVQGDIFQMPFRRGFFDKLFCFGVLQHTPDPQRAFLALPQFIKPGGSLVVDLYKKDFFKYVLGTKYWVRPVTRKLEPERLYRYVKRYVDLMWPLVSMVRRIPRFGPALNWRLLVADYSQEGLQGSILKEWAYLDTFDMLAPQYDYPQTLKTVRSWFQQALLEDVEIGDGYNGIEGRGTRPSGEQHQSSLTKVS